MLGLIPNFGAAQPQKESAPAKPEPGFAKQLKPTVSLAVLQEKTALYLQGKTNAKVFAGVLKAAFGDKLSSVLPEILENLPKAKSDELAKAIGK